MFDSYPVLHVCLKVRDFIGFVQCIFFLWVISEGPQLNRIALYLFYMPECVLTGCSSRKTLDNIFYSSWRQFSTEGNFLVSWRIVGQDVELG